ncbi:MAG: hypothetical protein ACRYFX_18560 [Janthinobacterium lividum]
MSIYPATREYWLGLVGQYEAKAAKYEADSPKHTEWASLAHTIRCYAFMYTRPANG